jgi:hypothetical protein
LDVSHAGFPILSAAVYSLFYTIMLRQLPVARPEQLVEFLFSGDSGQFRDDGAKNVSKRVFSVLGLRRLGREIMG